MIPSSAILDGVAADMLPENKAAPVLVYCRSGKRSRLASEALATQYNYTQVENLEPGIVGWQEAGLPVDF